MDRKITLLILAILALCPSPGFTQSAGAISITTLQIFQASTGRTTYTCATVKGTVVAGKLVGSNQELFITYTRLIKNLKALKQTAKRKAKIKTYNKQKLSGDRLCKQTAAGQTGQETPVQTPVPGATATATPTHSAATPTPTATPATSTGNFDSSGNVTAAGKKLFGIPSNLSANVSKGSTVHQNFCTRCHNDKINRTFSQYRTLIANSDMRITSSDLPDSDLADLTAYLNRTRR